MSLLSRVERAQQPADAPNAGARVPLLPPAPLTPARAAAREELLLDIRVRLQGEVMGAFDSLLDIADPAELQKKVEAIVDRVIRVNGFAVTHDERSRLIDELIGEVGGLGPLDALLLDETITEIMVNGPRHIYIERGGKIQRVDTYFLNDEHVLRIIDRIITPLGRRIDQSSPRVDARLPDGSRVNAVIEPL
ncbi:MAG: Flp pilus assembly complex ATPase component TadA, partial [Actinomycetota bacterium]|nr:Flp pilus assembly complex ATPase component TadA [Actinomycetota bacterium]